MLEGKEVEARLQFSVEAGSGDCPGKAAEIALVTAIDEALLFTVPGKKMSLVGQVRVCGTSSGLACPQLTSEACMVASITGIEFLDDNSEDVRSRVGSIYLQLHLALERLRSLSRAPEGIRSGLWLAPDKLSSVFLYSSDVELVDIAPATSERTPGLPWAELATGAAIFGGALVACKALDRARARFARGHDTPVSYDHKVALLGLASAYDVISDATFLLFDLRSNLDRHASLRLWFIVGSAFFAVNFAANIALLTRFMASEMRHSKAVVTWIREHQAVVAPILLLSTTSLESMRLLSR